MHLNTDLSRRVVMATANMEWVTSPLPGVMRRMLDRDGEDGSRRAISVVRYEPGSRFSAHVHGRGQRR
jgi:anti-sigma factor ChrR (cupin superfamily)